MKQEERSATVSHPVCPRGRGAGTAFPAGRPRQGEIIARYFDNPIHVAYNREFNIYTGTPAGEKVAACSTGIGGLRR